MATCSNIGSDTPCPHWKAGICYGGFSRTKRPANSPVCLEIGDVSKLTKRKVRAVKRKLEDDPVMNERFNRFYTLYPRHKEVGKVRSWFVDNHPDERKMEEIMSGLARQLSGMKSSIAEAGDDRYIKYPHRWLDGECWKDEDTGAPDPAEALRKAYPTRREQR